MRNEGGHTCKLLNQGHEFRKLPTNNVGIRPPGHREGVDGKNSTAENLPGQARLLLIHFQQRRFESCCCVPVQPDLTTLPLLPRMLHGCGVWSSERRPEEAPSECT